MRFALAVMLAVLVLGCRDKRLDLDRADAVRDLIEVETQRSILNAVMRGNAEERAKIDAEQKSLDAQVKTAPRNDVKLDLLKRSIAKGDEAIALLEEQQHKIDERAALRKKSTTLRAHIAEIDKLQKPADDAAALPAETKDYDGSPADDAMAKCVLGLGPCPEGVRPLNGGDPRPH